MVFFYAGEQLATANMWVLMLKWQPLPTYPSTYSRWWCTTSNNNNNNIRPFLDVRGWQNQKQQQDCRCPMATSFHLQELFRPIWYGTNTHTDCPCVSLIPSRGLHPHSTPGGDFCVVYFDWKIITARWRFALWWNCWVSCMTSGRLVGVECAAVHVAHWDGELGMVGDGGGGGGEYGEWGNFALALSGWLLKRFRGNRSLLL